MTTSASVPARSRLLRRTLLIGCALAGLGAAAGGAHAQAFNGTPTTIYGGVSYSRATPGVETVTVTTNSAVIDWVPTAGVFLPAGNTATFINAVDNANFVVLNRIGSTSPVRFDGTVLSRLVDATGNVTTGGVVMFSSPGGLIIGSTGVFDVGSLVLTTLNVDVDTNGRFYDEATRGITLSTGPSPIGNPAVVTEAGAQLNALQPNSFVALIGPVVQHGGATRVNGSAAYVAGEAVTFRANQGLFDIIVSTGSAAATPLTHTGSTGGPANASDADRHSIYLVAMPKNQAITAVLQGDIGFDTAVSASFENGVIVLSAGANVRNGEVDRYGHLTGVAASPNQQASFNINGGTITSDLIGVARTNIRARPVNVPTLTFQQDVSLFADNLASISVDTGGTVTVLGNALVSAAVFDTPTAAGLDLTGGTARIFTNDGGTIHIFGTATVDASAQGLPGNFGFPGSGTGGNADVSAAANGTITIDGTLAVIARGEGGFSIDPPQIDGAAGTGGTASINAGGGGSVIANGTVTLDASGEASLSGAGATQDAAVGTGGTAQVLALTGGTVTIAQDFTATANGFGGTLFDFGSAFAGGNGQGGTIGIGTGGGTATFNGGVNMNAQGSGGAGPSGGQGTGGVIQVQATAGTINFTGGATGAATGTGGDSFTGGVQGGTGQGGSVQVVALSGTSASRIAGGAINLSASGQGGMGGNPIVGQAAGTGGGGIGGVVFVRGESGNGAVQFGAVQLAADGTGGAGGSADGETGGGVGGSGTGGTATLGAQATANVAQTTGGTTVASADVSARGIGGTGGFGTGTGGNGVGGTAGISATGAPVTVTGQTSLSGDGRGGAGGGAPSGAIGTAGRGTGGTVNIGAGVSSLAPAVGTVTLATVTGSASGLVGATGNSAGSWHVGTSGAGTSVNATNMTLTATAAGTTPGAPPASTLDLRNGTITVSGTAQLSTDGDIQVNAVQTGRVAGGRYELVSGRDVVMSHVAPPAGAFTVDVANLYVQAARDLTLNAGVATRASAITDLRAMRLATIAGRVTGQEIRVGSIDLDLPATGQIGDAATQLVVLDVDGGDNGPLPSAPTPSLGLGPNQFTVLGGTTQGPGYTLTTAEAGRIRAGTLRILVPALGSGATRAPDLIVRDLTVNGGGAGSGLGTLEIISPGIGRVEGNVLMTGARTQDGLLINARDRLEVVTPTASVRVRDPNGAPGGTLTLVSNNLWVASSAIIDLLRADPGYAGRDDDLIDDDGVNAPRGFVEGNAVQLTTRGTLFVQNTTSARGTFASGRDFGGVTTGAGGLTISALGTVPASVYAFGRRLNPDGTYTTGDVFFFGSTYDAGGAPLVAGYTANAALNTCIIVTGQCAPRVPGTTGTDGKEPVIGPTDGSVAIPLPQNENDDVIDSSFAADPLIEEPVTSGSEPGQWNCDPDHDGDCDDQPQ